MDDNPPASPSCAALPLHHQRTWKRTLLPWVVFTDLGNAHEAAAGYYPPSGGEWDWKAISSNARGNVMLLHGDNDPFIGLPEPRHVAASLGCELRVEEGRSHFFEPGEDLVDATYAVLERALGGDSVYLGKG